MKKKLTKNQFFLSFYNPVLISGKMMKLFNNKMVQNSLPSIHEKNFSQSSNEILSSQFSLLALYYVGR
jgi:hypothetical protein